MSTDNLIENSVRSELHWSPHLDTRDVAVNVHEGVVTLTGSARDACESSEIEDLTKRITGVLAVANDLEVRGPADAVHSDTRIATAIVNTLKLEIPTLVTSIKVLVNHGRVTLEGNTEHRFLRDQAETLARRIEGVSDVSNNIIVKLRADPDEIKRRIECAFRKIIEVDCHSIKVEARGCIVTLDGEVRSQSERMEAERTAAETPGVTEVRNNIVVLK